eukprot:TRINITY_DN1551_c0_g1_i5.p1 TRINITY_DN1551_c0_g1~~TRINITY_DN1551_c0_g1_i5.p1  ORF type:complete len:1327 (+),score=322.51 TRINITY_DN1551_c0_g1_i5:47-4027(+)
MSLPTSIIIALSLLGTTFGQCDDMAGDWYDAATEDVMRVSVVGCELTSKYGTANVNNDMSVTPTNGILQTLEISGSYDNRTGTIKWTNGIKWIRSLTSEMKEKMTSMESRLNEVEAAITLLINNQSNEISILAGQIRELNDTVGGGGGGSPCNPNCTNGQQPATANHSDELLMISDRVQILNETIINMSTTCTTNCSQPAAADNVQDLADQIQVLNQTITTINNTRCEANCTPSDNERQELVDQIKSLNESITNNTGCSCDAGLEQKINSLNDTVNTINNTMCSSCTSTSINSTDIQLLDDRITSLNDTLDMKCSNSCNTNSNSNTSQIIQNLEQQLQDLNDTIAEVNNSKCSSCGGGQGTDLQSITDTIQLLNDTINNIDSTSGKDGYCTIEPNMTDVYIPVTRYVHRKSAATANKCTVGGPAWRGGTANKDSASMMTRSVIDDGNCRWGTTMSQEPMLAYKGDTIVFWRNGAKSPTLYEFDDEKAFNECDFDRSTLLASRADFEALESAGKNYSLTADKSGPRYFGSDYEGEINPERKTYCWDPAVPFPGPGTLKNGNKGNAAKITIMVLDPTEEVLATCPLYDPSKYGVSGGQEVDSETVQRLKGSVAAMGRQLISIETRIAQRARSEGNSGISVVRAKAGGTDAYYTATYADGGAAASHDHANTHHTIGMGEFEAVLNGVHFTTRHNDYSLLEADESLTAAEFANSWPPATKPIEPSPVPPSVLSAGSVSNQIDEMKEYFRAFKNQNTTHRDYRPYFKPVLCYLEGAWTESQDAIAEPFASERHHIDADTWMDLNQKTNFLVNSGLKNNLENLPILPTAFRAMKNGNDTFEPIIGQWFYRIVCKQLNHDIPLSRMRILNDVHNQFRTSKPSTLESMESTRLPVYEFNPTSDSSYDPVDPWPKGRWRNDYLDYLMGQLPGFDGPKADLQDSAFGYNVVDDSGSHLNTAFYTRYYSLAKKDAMGNTGRKRSFNDASLFAAQTTNKKISPQTVCAEFDDDFIDQMTPDDKLREAECKSRAKDDCDMEWTGDFGPGSDRAVCRLSGKSCNYKKCWTQRWTYAVPLEVIYQNPLINWNPYNIEYHTTSPGEDDVTSGGRNGKKGKAFKGANSKNYFRTPASMFKEIKDKSNADTSGGVTYVLDKNGKEREVVASGHWINIPEIPGIPGTIRQRYPVFPIHEHGSTAWKELKALQEMVINKDDQYVKKILEEIRITAYGVELRLTGGGHSHTISITPKELKQLQTGAKTEIQKTTSVDEAHSHRVLVKFDVTQTSVYDQWAIVWCSQTDKSCGSRTDTLSQGSCTTTSPSCCRGQCPDMHNVLDVVVH